eukprot:gene6369-8771_t
MSSKKKEKVSSAKNDQSGENAFPASFVISRQLDQEKINFLTKRIEELLSNNNELRTSSTQNERDTHDIVLYFQREMEMKDEVILRLNEELVKSQTLMKFEVEKVRKAYEAEMSELRFSSEKTISDLKSKLKVTEEDLNAIEIYRQEKDTHEALIARLEKNTQTQREQLIDAMEEQERRFLEEKSQLFKDLDEQKAAFREVALKEARSTMGEEAKKLLVDNNRMFEELKFHHAEAAEFQTEKAKLILQLATAKREVDILAEKELEYAKQAHTRTKEIKALRERVEQLEKQQSVNIERFKIKAKELKSTVAKELEEATLDAAGLRRLIHIKNKELKQMKALASTILSQRSETEQFFLEALYEVKEVIRKERKISFSQAKLIETKLHHGAGYGGGATAKKSTGTFPPLNIKGNNLYLLDDNKKSSQFNINDLPNVTLKDLSWEDKELVLRVLFSKMNVTQNQVNKATTKGQPMPKPVFISEGAFFPPGNESEEAAIYQNNFEINNNDNNSNNIDNNNYSPFNNQYNRSNHSGSASANTPFTLNPDKIYNDNTYGRTEESVSHGLTAVSFTSASSADDEDYDMGRLSVLNDSIE